VAEYTGRNITPATGPQPPEDQIGPVGVRVESKPKDATTLSNPVPNADTVVPFAGRVAELRRLLGCEIPALLKGQLKECALALGRRHDSSTLLNHYGLGLSRSDAHRKPAKPTTMIPATAFRAGSGHAEQLPLRKIENKQLIVLVKRSAKPKFESSILSRASKSQKLNNLPLRPSQRWKGSKGVETGLKGRKKVRSSQTEIEATFNSARCPQKFDKATESV
jgi:hypothetical protein